MGSGPAKEDCMPLDETSRERPIGRCKNPVCPGEMHVVPSDPDKLPMVVWTWGDEEGGQLEAMRSGLPEWCPRCHPGRG